MLLHLVLSPPLLADPQTHLLSHIYLGALFLMLSLVKLKSSIKAQLRWLLLHEVFPNHFDKKRFTSPTALCFFY